MCTTGHERLIQLAVIAGAHGVRGALKLKTFTGEPDAVLDYGPLLGRDGKSLVDGQVIGGWKFGVIVKAKGIDDRDTAEAMRGLELFVPRSQLPAPEQDEFYHSDLIGLAAQARDGTELGKVIAVHDFGAGDLIEIKGDGEPFLVPFTQAHVPAIDLAAGVIRVDPPQEVAA